MSLIHHTIECQRKPIGPKRGHRPPLRTQFRVEAAVGDLNPARRFFPRARAARAQSQRFGPVSAASAANTRDARVTAAQARPRPAAPGRASGGRAPQLRRRVALPRRPRVGRPRRRPRVNRRPARPRCDRVGPGRHRSRAPSRWPARPCAPCQARLRRGRGRRRVRTRAASAASALALGRVRAGAASVPPPVFGWVPGSAAAGPPGASARNTKSTSEVPGVLLTRRV